MQKALGLILAGLGAAALAGAAVAANRDSHIMKVPLPDGSTVRVEYGGDIAPKVTVVPDAAGPFEMFDHSLFGMGRQIDAMMRQVEAMTPAPIAVAGQSGINVAAYGNPPAGMQSVTVVSTSNGAKTCTRTTEVTSQGSGEPPKVVSKVSGDCGSSLAAPAPEKPTA